jgi:hypothetical protein
LGSVERCFELGGWDVAAVAVQPLVVEPVHPDSPPEVVATADNASFEEDDFSISEGARQFKVSFVITATQDLKELQDGATGELLGFNGAPVDNEVCGGSHLHERELLEGRRVGARDHEAMDPLHGVEVSELVSQLVPMCQAIIELTDAAMALAPPSGLPAAESKAMAERAEESPLRNEHWTEPVRAAHSMSGVLRFAATDHFRNYARLFVTEPVPVYSHLVLARAALDASGMTYWLSDCGISAPTRVMRHQTLRLMNAAELDKSKVGDAKATAKRSRANVMAGAQANGWAAFRKNPRCCTEEKPRSKSLIRAVLDDDRIFGPDEAGIGDLLWWYLSGVTHSATYALMQSVEALEDAPRVVTGEPMAKIFTSSASVAIMGLTTARGYANAISENARLMGWESERWAAALAAVSDLSRHLPIVLPPLRS